MHRGEVREHAAEPAVVHVGHPDARGLLGHGLLGLLLGADEEDGAAVRDGLLDELVRAVDVRQRLLEVDDVDAVALGEDEALHLRVPTAGLVPEVDTALEELAHGHDGHDTSFRRAARDPPGARTLLAAPPVGRAAVRLSVTTLVVAPLAPPVPTPATHRGRCEQDRRRTRPRPGPGRTGRRGRGRDARSRPAPSSAEVVPRAGHGERAGRSGKSTRRQGRPQPPSCAVARTARPQPGPPRPRLLAFLRHAGAVTVDHARAPSARSSARASGRRPAHPPDRPRGGGVGRSHGHLAGLPPGRATRRRARVRGAVLALGVIVTLGTPVAGAATAPDAGSGAASTGWVPARPGRRRPGRARTVRPARARLAARTPRRRPRGRPRRERPLACSRRGVVHRARGGPRRGRRPARRRAAHLARAGDGVGRARRARRARLRARHGAARGERPGEPLRRHVRALGRASRRALSRPAGSPRRPAPIVLLPLGEG